MISIIVLFMALSIALGNGASINEKPSRIVGGQVTSIEEYPYAAAVLTNGGSGLFRQACGGTILTNRIILSAASCFGSGWFPTSQWRVRVGSTYGSSGGSVYNVRNYASHAGYSIAHTRDDILVLQTSEVIQYGPNVVPAQLAGAGYMLPDNEVVWSIGWGYSEVSGTSNDILREVDVLVIEHVDCVRHYPYIVTGLGQMCTGWLGIGGKDSCTGDVGGPVVHKGSQGDVVVGICSWASTCGQPDSPGVNTRVSEYAAWIVSSVWSLNNS